MNRKDGFNRFYLDNDGIFDQEIDTVAEIDRDSVINDGKHLLGFEHEAKPSHLMRHAYPIRPLQQPRSEPGMHGTGGSQNATRGLGLDESDTVASVRLRVLRGTAFVKQVSLRP
jgi:hypothetical protein